MGVRRCWWRRWELERLYGPGREVTAVALEEGYELGIVVFVFVLAFMAGNGGEMSGIGVEFGCWYECI